MRPAASWDRATTSPPATATMSASDKGVPSWTGTAVRLRARPAPSNRTADDRGRTTVRRAQPGAVSRRGLQHHEIEDAEDGDHRDSPEDQRPACGLGVAVGCRAADPERLRLVAKRGREQDAPEDAQEHIEDDRRRDPEGGEGEIADEDHPDPGEGQNDVAGIGQARVEVLDPLE